MLDKSLVIKSFLITIISIFSFTSVFASCPISEPRFEIESGGFDLGNFSQDDIVHIKSDLGEHPLQVRMYFSSQNQECIEDDGSNVKFRLASMGTQLEPDEFNSLEELEFIFDISGDIKLDNFFQSSYLIDGEEISAITFRGDDEPPIIDLSSDTNQAVLPGTEVTLSYDVEDQGSGIVSVVSGSNETTFEEPVSSHSGVETFEVDSSTDFVVRATDALGQTSSQSIRFSVDGDAPSISSFTNRGYDYQNGIRRVSYSVLISDTSFSDQTPIESLISADFSDQGILSANQAPSSCTYIEEETFQCVWSNIRIDGTQTTDINVEFNVEDELGNSQTHTRSTQVFIDTSAPIISTFETVNRIGERNILSGHTNNATLLLEFNDQSIDEGYDINLDLDVFRLSEISQTSCGQGCYIFDISNELDRLIGDVRDQFEISARISDVYDNTQTISEDIIIDNNRPNVLNFSYSVRGEVQTGVVRSGDRLDFDIEFREKNFDNQRIFANFQPITGTNREYSPSCSETTQSDVYECNFRNVEVATGYFERNISIVIEDDAGNREVYQTPIEVLKRNEDDVPTAFSIDDLTIINPINRNNVLEERAIAKAWFEGTIDKLDPEYEIISFSLRTACDERFLGGLLPLNTNSPRLFPNHDQTQFNVDNVSEFSILVELGAVTEGGDIENVRNPENLQDISMNCSAFVLYRDDTTVYEPGQIVNFTLDFSFYDMPRENHLHAHAESLKEKIDDANRISSRFENLNEILSTMSNVCTMITTGLQAYETTMLVLGPVVEGLKSNPWTYPSAKSISEATRPSQGSLSNLGQGVGQYVERACRWVTCEIGSLDVFYGPDEQGNYGSSAIRDSLDDWNQVVGGAICEGISE